MAGYYVLRAQGTAEIVEKKSRFIAYVSIVHSEAEATAFLEGIRKKHWDARHNCYAYVTGEHNEHQRCSDDGEPSGTAGKPILEIISGRGLHDCIVVVTRYFGGVLLGTGGLVRAYSAAAAAGIAAAGVCRRVKGRKIKLAMDYAAFDKVKRTVQLNGGQIMDTVYTSQVTVEVQVETDKAQELLQALREATAGGIAIEADEETDITMEEADVQ